MEKLIIENRSSKSMSDVLLYVRHVVDDGRISPSRNGDGYCFVTTWGGDSNLLIYASKNEHSDKFVAEDLNDGQ